MRLKGIEKIHTVKEHRHVCSKISSKFKTEDRKRKYRDITLMTVIQKLLTKIVLEQHQPYTAALLFSKNNKDFVYINPLGILQYICNP